MDSIIKKLRGVYQNSCSVALATATVCVLSYLFSFNTKPAIVFLACVITKAIIVFISKRKNYLLIILMALAFIIFIYFGLRILHFDVIEKTKLLHIWTKNFLISRRDYNAVYAYVVILISIVPVSIASHYIDKYYISRLSTCIAVFAFIVVMSINNKDIPKFCVCLIIFYLLNIMIENINLLYNKTINKNNSRLSAVYLMPVCTFIALFIFLLPSGSKPIQWTWVKSFAHSVYRSTENLFHNIKIGFLNMNSEFSYGTLGYSDKDKTLGGSIAQGDGIMLYANMASRPNGGVYLTGSVKNQFTGTSWKNTLPQNEFKYEEYRLDYYELIAFLMNSNVPQKEMRNYIEKYSLVIEYKELVTKSMFYSLKAYSFSDLNSATNFNSNSPSMTFKKTKSDGTSYIVKFLNVNYSSDDFSKLCIQADGIEYGSVDYYDSDFISYINNSFGFSLSGDDIKILNDTYKKRSELIEKYYTSLPDSIPDRVYELADEITVGLATNYEKLRAIESYISMNYTYSTEPGITPENRDFVDYFLFDSKTGYCTYYSTAMAVLARCEGIPTRYVEGAILDFATPAGIKGYAVLNNSSHAWVEAYIEGIGWIPFEPTKTYSEKRYTEWKNSGSYSGSYDFNNNQYLDNKTEQNNDNEITHSENVNKIPIFSILVIAFVGIFLFMATSVFSYFLVKIKYKRRMKKADLNERALTEFNETLFLLGLNGYRILTSDTIKTFSERVGRTFLCDNISLKDVSGIFMKIRYADKEISDKEAQRINKFRVYVESEIAQKTSKLRFLFIKMKIFTSQI